MKVLFVYCGSEQGSWGSIAFSRPQHYYIMPGILYCAAGLRASGIFDPSTIFSCRYFNTTMQTENEIFLEIVEEKPDVVGFSCYCWNMDLHRLLMTLIRKHLPECVLLCGGPEVRCSSLAEAKTFFNASPECDALLFGEAELRIALLIKALTHPSGFLPRDLAGFALNPGRFTDAADFSTAGPVQPESIPSPYPFDLNIRVSPGAGRAMVFETMRGCPQKCVYCQFSRRDHVVRKFPLERMYKELEWLLESGIECLHVADSVFDIDTARACDLLAFFRDRNRATSLFCYCAFVHVDEKIVALFEATRAQIGVGVQSTNPDALRIIERTIRPSRLFEQRKLLQSSRLNFYIDLMFGLPADSVELFEKSFNETVALRPSFMMLFPLSLIRGTPLGDAPGAYGVRPITASGLNLLCDIRYDNIALYSGFEAADLERFDDMALACFYFYNRFALSIGYLLERSTDPAATMTRIGKKTKQFLRLQGRLATNTDWLEGFQERIHAIFQEEAGVLGAGVAECSAFEDLFKLDIYRILAVHAPQREKTFRRLEAIRRQPLRPQEVSLDRINAVYLAATGKKIRLSYYWVDLCALAALRESIAPAPDAVYLHAPYEDWDARIVPLSPLEETIVETLPADRPIRLNHLLGPALRQARKASASGNPESDVHRAIARLAREGIIFCADSVPAHR